MVKLLFVQIADTSTEDLLQALSFILLIPPSQIKAKEFFKWNVRSNEKKEKNNLNELLALTVLRMKELARLTIVELKSPLLSDAHLIENFQQSYIGAINSKISKANLIKLANLQENLAYCENTTNAIRRVFINVEGNFSKTGLDESARRELKKAAALSLVPIENWVESNTKSIKNEIDELAKFVTRGF